MRTPDVSDVVDYQILVYRFGHGPSEPSVQEQVNRLLKEGYQLRGDLVASPDRIFQVMVLLRKDSSHDTYA